jgi:hypothetical protein
MRKREDDGIPSVKKPSRDMSEESGISEGTKERGEATNEREAAAQDFLDAIAEGDAKALVDAFIALDMACGEDGEGEGEEEEEEEEGGSMGEPKKSPKDLVSIILAKKKA